MCCEEHHICTHCDQIITSTTDRCFAWRAAYRNPGTEFGSSACPDGEEIVEEFYHDDDGFYCPNCSPSSPSSLSPHLSSSAAARNDDIYQSIMDRPRPPPIDPLSGEEVVAVDKDDDSSPTSDVSASSGEGGGAATTRTANAKGGGNGSDTAGGSWRLRVRKIVSGTTRLTGAGKRRDDDDAVLGERGLLPPSADKRGTKTTVTTSAGDGGAAVPSGPPSLL